MNIDVVFQGGGVKAIAFVGAIQALEQNGYTFKRFAGTSAGAITAALLCAGYSGEELKQIMLNMDYTKILSSGIYSGIPLMGNALELIKSKGFYDARLIEQWMYKLLKKKGIVKFKDIETYEKGTLKIIAADVTKKNILILPDDLKNYGIEPSEFEVAKAVRMSVSIPFFFRPVKLKVNHNVSYIVDGGIVSNFPIWIFDVGNNPRWPTFGFKLKNNTKKQINKQGDDLFSYFIDVIETMVDRNEEEYLPDRNAIRTITIDTEGVRTTEFNISRKKCIKLYESGFNSTNEFLNSWSFHDYISKYRK
jgi:NTE family protein